MNEREIKEDINKKISLDEVTEYLKEVDLELGNLLNLSCDVKLLDHNLKKLNDNHN